MTIKELYFACGNFYNSTKVRVYPNPLKNELKGSIYYGKFEHMPLTIKEQELECFEFDNDLQELLISLAD